MNYCVPMAAGRAVLITWIIFNAILSADCCFAQIEQNESFTSKVIIDPTERNSIFLNLKQDLKREKIEYRIYKCELVMSYDYPVEGRDGSFGAVCDALHDRHLKKITMCDDYMVGKFTWKIGEITQNQLVEFIRNNCPPGA